jgi:hypothetical protein
MGEMLTALRAVVAVMSDTTFATTTCKCDIGRAGIARLVPVTIFVGYCCCSQDCKRQEECAPTSQATSTLLQFPRQPSGAHAIYAPSTHKRSTPAQSRLCSSGAHTCISAALRRRRSRDTTPSVAHAHTMCKTSTGINTTDWRRFQSIYVRTR